MNNDGFFKENILNAMNNSICIYDYRGKVLYCNDSFRKAYLKDILLVDGFNFSDISNEEYKKISFISEALSSNERISKEQRCGSYGVFSVIALPLTDIKNNRKIIVEFISSIDTKSSIITKKASNSVSTQNIIINDIPMKYILETINRISNFDSTILITGESGTGKSMLAKFIHETSTRSNESFVVINCATIPENLIESELFGYVSGAFTGAQNRGKPGMVELAHKGTLFLDEIGLLPLNLQAKFLQLVQDKTYTPIGALKSKTVDIRIISATNQNLREQIISNKFREDLYYRLRVIEFNMPPLRDRPEAIEPLIDCFINALNKKYSIKKTISKEAKELLKNHTWLGNIRELQYLVELLIVTSKENLISSSDVPPLSNAKKASTNFNSSQEIKFDDEVAGFEKKILQNAFLIHKSSYKMADALGMTQTRVSRLLRKYNIR